MGGRESSEGAAASGSLMVELGNNDFAPVTFRFYSGTKALGHLFDTPLLEAKLGPGERREVSVPSVSAADRTSAGDGEESAPFELEVQGATGKTCCNARAGQVVTYEGCMRY